MKRKHFIKGSVVLGVFCACLFAGITLVGQETVSVQGQALVLASPMLLGQEWSPEQKEVWNTAEKLWELLAKEDLDGLLSYFHPDFRGWYSEDPLPSDKASRRKWISYNFETEEPLVYELNPIAIDVHGNVAFVHFYFTVAYKDAEGKHRTARGRWTDIYMKEGDKWLLICDHGGPTSVE